MIKKTTLSLIVAGIVGISPALASGNHDGMDMHHEAMNADMHHEAGKGHMHGKMAGEMKGSANGMLLVRKVIDGYQASFHIMKSPEGMEQHGGDYHFMFKAEKDGKALTDLTVNSKITHPNGKSESKMMMKMGDWYMAGYDLSHQGQHQLMVLFKTADGKKHFGGIFYPQQSKE